MLLYIVQIEQGWREKGAALQTLCLLPLPGKHKGPDTPWLALLSLCAPTAGVVTSQFKESQIPAVSGLLGWLAQDAQ